MTKENVRARTGRKDTILKIDKTVEKFGDSQICTECKVVHSESVNVTDLHTCAHTERERERE